MIGKTTGWKRPRRAPQRCRGSIYLMTLSVAMVLMVIGASTVIAVRIQVRKSMSETGISHAALLAFSGLEHAAREIQNNTAWRTAYTHDVLNPAISLNGGTFRWKLIDETDGDLADSDEDPVTIQATGYYGGAEQTYKINMILHGGTSLDVLRNAVHAGGNLEVLPATTGGATGAPVGSNATLIVGTGSTLNASAEAISFSNSGTITGTQTALTSPRQMPGHTVFTNLKSRATTINYFSIPSGTMEGVILSPTSNPYGPTNAEGIYHIRVPWRNYALKVRDLHIRGTLIVELDEKDRIDVDGSVIWEATSPELPVLVVKANHWDSTEVRIENQGVLDEALWFKNFNPPGEPINGATNTNSSDIHPTYIRGLIHVIRNSGDISETRIANADEKKGCIIADGYVTLQSGATVIHDPSIHTTRPPGYTGGVGAILLPDPSSFRRVVP